MQAVVELIIGWIAMIAVATLMQFGVMGSGLGSSDREVRRLAPDCGQPMTPQQVAQPKRDNC